MATTCLFLVPGSACSHALALTCKLLIQHAVCGDLLQRSCPALGPIFNCWQVELIAFFRVSPVISSLSLLESTGDLHTAPQGLLLAVRTLLQDSVANFFSRGPRSSLCSCLTDLHSDRVIPTVIPCWARLVFHVLGIGVQYWDDGGRHAPIMVTSGGCCGVPVNGVHIKV